MIAYTSVEQKVLIRMNRGDLLWKAINEGGREKKVSRRNKKAERRSPVRDKARGRKKLTPAT